MPRIPAAIEPVFERFVSGPATIRRAIDGLDAAAFSRRPPGEDWSIRDIVVHLADAELVGAVRFRLSIAEERPQLPVYDHELWKRRLHYLFRDPEFALSSFQTTRYGTAELLQQCSADVWQREAVHPERGVMTVADLLELYALHAQEHAAQVAAFREAMR